MGTSVIIASGKGGTGKSFVTSGLGITLARLGQRVCIVDADIGLRDQDLLLGVENNVVYDLLDITEKHCDYTRVLIPVPEHDRLTLLPAAQFARVGDMDREAFRRLIRELKRTHDFVLIDCPAGIERGLRNTLSEIVDDALIVCTPDDVCIRNAERAAALIEKKLGLRPRLIVNRLDEELIRAGEMYSALTVAQTLDLPLFGEIPEDAMVRRAALNHLNPADIMCDSRSALVRVAGRLTGANEPLPGIGTGKRSFLQKLLHRKPKEVITIND
ncbi:MAG: septum site-determining protein MinD [Clostridia bacterium]|nr:septum site-determining protein MinD [Clostridia bacterium]